MFDPPGLVCSYPGCTTGGGVERCSEDGRLACAAHRTMRDGRYICLACDEDRAEQEAEQVVAAQEQAHRAWARSRHKILLWGSITSGAMMALLLYSVVFDTAVFGTQAEPDGVPVALVFFVLPVFTLIESDGFRRGRYARASRLKKAVYWIGTLWVWPIIGVLLVAGLILGVGLAVAGSEAERQRETGVIREEVRKGIDDARR